MSGTVPTQITPVEAAAPTRRWKFDGTVTLGAAVQIGLISAGLIGYFTSGQAKVDQTQRELAALQHVVADQNAGMRDSLKDATGRIEVALTGLGAQIRDLPGMAERVRQLEEGGKRLEARDAEFQRYLDERRGILDARMQALEGRAVEGAADRRELRGMLDGMQRASGVNLPGAPGMRHK
jgi:hypothetical protein